MNNMKSNPIRTFNPIFMKTLSTYYIMRWLMFALIPIVLLTACREDEDGFAITNDLRVLYVSVNGNRAETGAAALPVSSSVQMVFSHGLDQTAFENALSVTPDLDYTITYDETSSFVTISPDTRLDYDVTYTISLPQGSYGADGEATKEDFSYSISTSEFVPPSITLSATSMSFFEGEEVTVTATLSQVIFDDVTFDLVFTGSAEGEGVDYTASTTSITIPAQQTTATFTLSAIEGDAIEGNENISISLENIVNGTYTPAQPFTIALGDRAPSIELKGVMHLKTSTNGNGVRAVHLNVLKDIADLSTYGIEVNSNGSVTPINPLALDYFFPAMAVSAGDQILLVRDADAANAQVYFGACYAGFDHVLQTAAMSQNGDDAILLYNDGVSIETFGALAVDGTGQPWEYTGTWGYKLGEEWIYGTIDCANNVDTGTTQTSACVYPMCSAGLELKGIMDLNHNGGKNIRAYHVFALQDIADLSEFGVGIASNGQATSDGVEIPFTNISVEAGDHILVIREADIANAQAYFEGCYGKFDHIVSVPGTLLSSNGDDTIELFKNNTLIETYGALGVDGTGQLWDYDDSWAYKVGSVWTYGGVGCSTAAITNATSSCQYTFCN